MSDRKFISQSARKAFSSMSGRGTDDSLLIDAFTSCKSNEAIQEMKLAYAALFGYSLKKSIISETSGSFRTLLKALTDEKYYYICKKINAACSGLGTNEDCLIELLCLLDNDEIKKLKDSYKHFYPSIPSLEWHVIAETSGWREEGSVRNRTLVSEDCEKITKEEARSSTNESFWLEFLCTRSFGHIKLVIERVKSEGFHISDVIRKEFSGRCVTAFLLLVDRAQGKDRAVARLLHHALKGGNEASLVRLVALYFPLGSQLCFEYRLKYGTELVTDIGETTGGSFQRLILSLLSCVEK
ncbi:Annexin like protein [Aduncisulcus paluster]|uniref:Annexin like protein n=1 Tax=Aduncisulcus paluster TaxID=2918883 RepID=A0ABQ5K7X4_9EUKA|nr:Annexin like protein [Aduncisulcus paluster]